jgi:hypothetical protein
LGRKRGKFRISRFASAQCRGVDLATYGPGLQREFARSSWGSAERPSPLTCALTVLVVLLGRGRALNYSGPKVHCLQIGKQSLWLLLELFGLAQEVSRPLNQLLT